MRRFIVSMSTLVTVVLAMATAAPAAFASRIGPTDDGSAVVRSTHSGLDTWEIALIAVAVTVAVVALTAFVSGVRRRHALRPAAS